MDNEMMFCGKRVSDLTREELIEALEIAASMIKQERASRLRLIDLIGYPGISWEASRNDSW